MANNENQSEETLSAEVDALLEQGLSQKEIETKGYSPSLIRQRIRKRVKAGKSSPAPSGRDSALATRKTGESVLPEWVAAQVDLFDGSERDKNIFMSGMATVLMGLRLFTEAVKPLTDLMTTWQKAQSETARAQQGGIIEAAQAAGEAAAGGVAKFFMQEKPWLANAQNPLQAMMVDTMRPFFQQVMGNLMGTFMRPAPQGQPGAQALGQPGQLATGAGFETMSDEERKTVFGG